MSYLTPEQKATLLQLINVHKLGGLDPGSIANKLNQPRTRIIQGQTQPKPFKWSDILSLLSPEQARGVLSLPAVTTIIERAKEQDRPHLEEWAESLASAQMITADQKVAIEAILNATEPAPDKVETYDSVFAEAFPDFFIAITKHAGRLLPNGEWEKDENGQYGLFMESVTYHQCPPDLVIEAMS